MKDYFKKSKSFLALVLAVLIAFTMTPVQGVQAATVKTKAETTKEKAVETVKASATYSATGIITNSVTKKAVSGASLTLMKGSTAVGKAVKTNSKGEYTLTGLVANTTYTIKIVASGYNTTSFVAFKTTKNITGKNKAIAPVATKYQITGTIKGTNGALKDATVTLYKGTTKVGSAVKTDAKGNYKLANVPAGTGYTIKVAKAGYTTRDFVKFDVKKNITGKSVTLKAAVATYQISGRITGTNDVALENAEITLLQDDIVIRDGIKTDATGAYRILNVPAGDAYVITVEKVGYKPYTFNEFDVRSIIARKSVTLESTSAVDKYTVTGKVTVKDVTPEVVVTGATVKLMDGATQVGNTVTTNATGTYSITEVPAKTGYTLVVTATGYEDVTVPAFEVTGATTKDVAMVVKPVGFTVTGATVVTGSDNKVYNVTGTAFNAENVATLKLWKDGVDVTATAVEKFTFVSATAATMELKAALAEGATDYKVGPTVANAVAITVPGTVSVSDVKVINATTIKVIFSDTITTAKEALSNYTISAGKIESAKVTGDKEITLTVAELTYDQSFTLTVVNPAHTASVKVPTIGELYEVKVTTDTPETNDTIKSDGASMTMLTAKIWDKTAQAFLTNDAQIKYSTTLGSLSQPQVAMQNGAASTQLTSVYSAVSVSAIVTATVDSAPGNVQFVGLTGKLNVNFTPTGLSGGSISLVAPVSAGSSQGDRFTVTFSDDFSAKDNRNALLAAVKYVPYSSATPYSISVKDVYNLTPNTVVYILNTDTAGSTMTNYKTTKTTMLDATTSAGSSTPNFLRDNVMHSISFTGITGKVAASAKPLEFMMTDTSAPFVYGVTADNNMALEVRTSESLAEDMAEGFDIVDSKTNLDGTTNTNIYVNKHFAIDGKYLMLSPKLITASPSATYLANAVTFAKNNDYIVVDSLNVGKYTSELNDTRNKVFISINKDTKLASGAHGIEISTIGDWAGMVDKSQNMLTTQTFSFNVVADTAAPTATVTMQSPEQWLITFNKPVESTTTKTVADAIKIYTTTEYAKATKAAFVQNADSSANDYIVSVVDENGVKEGATLAPTDSLSGVQRLLVEFNRDWSVKLNGGSESMNNYWKTGISPFTVVIDAVETATGVAMAGTALPVSTPYDGVSPEIREAVDLNAKQATLFRKSVTADTTGKYVFVKMSEPVQLLTSTTTAMTNPTTPSTIQDANPTTNATYNNKTGIPVATYRFNKVDKTVYGDVAAGTLAEDDMTFVVAPRTPLEPGTWTLYIESISDDHGNTSPTTSTTVVVPVPEGGGPTGPVDTKVAWAAFDDAATDYDYLYVKYTKVMKAEGAANGVDSTKNYKFMGQELPVGTSITAGIKGITSVWDGATIRMPKDTWNGVGGTHIDFTTNMSVASNFLAADGSKIMTPYQFELTDRAGNASGADMDAVPALVLYEAAYGLKVAPATPAITATSLTPGAGDQTLVVTGRDFNTSATLADFMISGTGAAKIKKVTMTATQATFTATGLVADTDVIIITAKTSAFSPVAKAVSNTLTFITKAIGTATLTPAVGATTIVVTGTGFKAGALISDFTIGGANAAKVKSVVVTATTATFTVDALVANDTFTIQANASAFTAVTPASNVLTFVASYASVTSSPFTLVDTNNTVTITLSGGTFKATPIVAGDFEFTGTDAAALALGTFTRVDDTHVAISGLASRTGTDNVVTVKGATQATQATSVAAAATTVGVVTSDAFALITTNNTVVITLTGGTFKAGSIVAGDFTFTGTNAAALANGTFTRVDDKTVTITNLTGLVGTNNTVAVKIATLVTPATAVTAVAKTVPTATASAGALTDTDLSMGKLSGAFTVTEPSSITGITGYHLYWGTSASAKLGAQVAEVATGTASTSKTIYTFASTAIPATATHLLVYSYNADAEQTTPLAFPLAGMDVNNIPSGEYTITATTPAAGQIQFVGADIVVGGVTYPGTPTGIAAKAGNFTEVSAMLTGANKLTIGSMFTVGGAGGKTISMLKLKALAGEAASINLGSYAGTDITVDGGLTVNQLLTITGGSATAKVVINGGFVDIKGATFSSANGGITIVAGNVTLADTQTQFTATFPTPTGNATVVAGTGITLASVPTDGAPLTATAVVTVTSTSTPSSVSGTLKGTSAGVLKTYTASSLSDANYTVVVS